MNLSNFKERQDRLLTKPERLILLLTLIVLIAAAVISMRPGEAIRLQTNPATPEAAVTRELPQLLDLNAADLDALETLPGIGPALGQRILDYRAAHGGFSSPEELLQVEGIGEKTYASLAALVTVGGKEETHEDSGR